ncbi:MAG: phosphoribosylaminoimidazolesuccinocarboxamide synthase [Candidatus Ancaeobacter aquaticus]|nr:phosphoribosylaminoimidazolesuccinocarboxamide synthase [Candidatus Ancaeobacter aquaticus]
MMEAVSPNVVTQIKLDGVKLFKEGKVRSVFDLDDKLLIVASDRISAFDYILPEGIPYKAKVLTKISEHWFNFTKDIVKNHLISTDVSAFPGELEKFSSILDGRSMLVKKTELVPIECVVRGYISGSAWKEYKKTGTVCGEKLPEGYEESCKFVEPIFTPATKAEEGHDENISIQTMKDMVGTEITEKLQKASIEIYATCHKKALEEGIIIADTKYEFGMLDGELILIDELLTPDSSRFWPEDSYQPGRSQDSFDKQFVRDYLESIEWNKTPPVPHLPEDIIRKTSEKYQEAYKRITGLDLNQK